jgi:large subunit ribosomal protein L24e
MVQTRTCDYCGAEIDQGTGTMYVKVDGETMHFCSSKCEKNADLGRESRDVEWARKGGEE